MQNIHLYDEHRRVIMLETGQISPVPASVHEEALSVQRLLQNIQQWTVEVGLINADEQVACWI